MSFVLGLLLFTVVIGILDARLPWPIARKGSSGSGARSTTSAGGSR